MEVTVILNSVIACPVCGFKKGEEMPARKKISTIFNSLDKIPKFRPLQNSSGGKTVLNY